MQKIRGALYATCANIQASKTHDGGSWNEREGEPCFGETQQAELAQQCPYIKFTVERNKAKPYGFLPSIEARNTAVPSPVQQEDRAVQAAVQGGPCVPL